MSPPFATSPPLSEEQIERYARQIIVPGVGAEGQRKLCAAAVLVDGHPEGCSVAGQYLRAAGVRVAEPRSPGSRIDCMVVAGLTDLPRERVDVLSAAAPLVAWYAVVGGRVHGGLADAAHPILIPELEPGGRLAVHANIVHHIAGADVATTAVAALLGWIAPGDCYLFALT